VQPDLTRLVVTNSPYKPHAATEMLIPISHQSSPHRENTYRNSPRRASSCHQEPIYMEPNYLDLPDQGASIPLAISVAPSGTRGSLLRENPGTSISSTSPAPLVRPPSIVSAGLPCNIDTDAFTWASVTELGGRISLLHSGHC